MMKVRHLRTNHRIEPLGIDDIPEFSWQIESERANTVQTAYRIIVRSDDQTFWDSGRVESREQCFVLYSGDPLKSCTRYLWSVTVWDNYENSSMENAWFETAYLTHDRWRAKWIESTFPRPENPKYGLDKQSPAVLFEKTFTLDGKIQFARLYATAYGVYCPKLNDQRLDDREFAPEFTAYHKLHYYQTYDVAGLLNEGKNVLTFYVGDGWYHCPQCRSAVGEYHAYPAVLFQMEIEYTDGRIKTIYSDGSEVCYTGPIIYSDIFMGSILDATVHFSAPKAVTVRDYGYGQLAAQPMDPVRPIKQIPAERVYVSPKGEMIVDFGQILCGRAKVRIDAPYGQEIVLSYFEQPDIEGNYLNTMIAPQQDTFVSNGTPIWFESPFVFYGFRYIKVEGIGHIKAEDFIAVLLTTEKENIGDFKSDDPGLNRLYKNIRWSQSGNMLSVPTDCPSREKGGYTGDLQIYAATALGNEEMTAFLTSYLRNLSMEQAQDGVVPIVVPHTHIYDRLIRNHAEEFGQTGLTGVAGWSDAAVIVPWEMYRMTGNTRILQQQFASMKAWCDYVLDTAKTVSGGYPEEYDKWLWNTGFHFGEWHIPSEQYQPDHSHCKNSAQYTAPLFGYRSVSLFAEICKILHKEDIAYYQRSAEQMKKAIQKTIMAEGKMPTEFMGAYVLAFYFDVVPEEYRLLFSEHLVKKVEENGCKLDTGFLSTPYLLDVLVQIGRADLAEAVFWQREAPSWLYQVDMGATAIWENWFNLSPGKNSGYTSYNHYAFGCVDSWILTYICGIQAEEPGFQKIRIEPHPGRLSRLERSLRCPYGEIKVIIDGDQLQVKIPCNTTATVIWRGQKRICGSGEYTF